MKNKITYFTILITAIICFNPLFSQIQLGDDIDGEAADDNSGISVSLSSNGSRVAIGAPFNSGNGFYAGHVRIYEFTPVSIMTLNMKAIIKIHPNPTAGKVELRGIDSGTIKIIDNFGRIIMNAEISKPEIDISDLVPGIYFIQIILDGQMVTKKIIKE